ncbi:uncharacterized protein G2W53_034304 [Senna tora]|uniref:Uncharacterized protein n=1 Tax=Senna tora TaxID=362788 RepID=A0A834T161_9FABA|nr:uncharacterized protein G2W53_034304 [Senna tora]
MKLPFINLEHGWSCGPRRPPKARRDPYTLPIAMSLHKRASPRMRRVLDHVPLGHPAPDPEFPRLSPPPPIARADGNFSMNEIKIRKMKKEKERSVISGFMLILLKIEKY